jgi:hypothetical protein
MHGLEEPGAGQMRMAPILFHGLSQLGLPLVCVESRQAYQALKSLAPRLEDDATTTWRFRQCAGDRLGRRRRLALMNQDPFAVENANMRLVHRNIGPAK